MKTEQKAIKAVAKAIYELDSASFSRKTEKDQATWDIARAFLYEILDENGYELCESDSKRIKKKK